MEIMFKAETNMAQLMRIRIVYLIEKDSFSVGTDAGESLSFDDRRQCQYSFLLMLRRPHFAMNIGNRNKLKRDLKDLSFIK